MKIKCGVVGVVGLPNAGKSSLVNALIQEKVSIVSPKPQTTRNNVMGILNDKDSQIVFVDTPGLNKADSGLGDYMQKSIKGAVNDVSAICLVVDIVKGVTKKDLQLIDNFYLSKTPVIVVLSKTDLVNDEKVVKTLESFAPIIDKCEVVPVSSLKHKNLDTLLEVVKKYLPEVNEDEKLFDEDYYTDKPLNFLVAEIVREKALYLLNDEIPHGIAVKVESFKEDDSLCTIDCLIVCEKDSHKAIILGKQGEMIKKIGHNARVTIQKIVQKKVVLNLFVKVKRNWQNNLEFLDSLGYNVKDL